MDLQSIVNVDILTEQKTGKRKLLKIYQQTEGNLIVKDGSWLLTYNEPTDSRIMPTSARLLVDKDKKVMLDRIGDDPISLMFEEGKQHISRLDLPNGSMNVGFFTNKLKMALNQQGGTIKLKYTMTAQDLDPVNTTMNFTISPKI